MLPNFKFRCTTYVQAIYIRFKLNILRKCLSYPEWGSRKTSSEQLIILALLIKLLVLNMSIRYVYIDGKRFLEKKYYRINTVIYHAFNTYFEFIESIHLNNVNHTAKLQLTYMYL